MTASIIVFFAAVGLAALWVLGIHCWISNEENERQHLDELTKAQTPSGR
jgi:uncharacterized membrane protein YuzA (DUF378 family)